MKEPREDPNRDQRRPRDLMTQNMRVLQHSWRAVYTIPHRHSQCRRRRRHRCRCLPPRRAPSRQTPRLPASVSAGAWDSHARALTPPTSLPSSLPPSSLALSQGARRRLKYAEGLAELHRWQREAELLQREQLRIQVVSLLSPSSLCPLPLLSRSQSSSSSAYRLLSPPSPSLSRPTPTGAA